MIINNCTCEGYKQIVYECTIFGGAATVWGGSAFNCPGTNNEIVLLHNADSTVQGSCSDSKIVASIIRVDNNSSAYTSQLTLISNNVSTTTISGQNVTCSYDSGGGETEIGVSLLAISEGKIYVL